MITITLIGLILVAGIAITLMWFEPDHNWDEDVQL